MQEKAELVKVFSRASLKVQAMVTRKVLSDEEKAELQGLFQQATVGDGNMWKMLNDPKFLVDGDVLAKTNSWMPLRGMSKEEAMERYVDRVEILVASYHVHFAPSRASSCASLQSASTTFTNLSR